MPENDVGLQELTLGDRVRVMSGDYSGRLGTYEGYDEDAFGSWHCVHLDGDGIRDPYVRVDRVEKVHA